MSNNSTSTPNTTPSTVSYRPGGGSLSVQFGGANDPDDTFPQGSLPGSNHGGGRITYANGVTTSETFKSHSVHQSDVINDHIAGAGESILKTARTLWGTLGRPLTPQSIVTIGGMDTSLAAAEQLGYVSRNADGNYVETGVTLASQKEDQQREQEEQAKLEQEDSFEFHPEHLAKIDELIEPIPQAMYDKSITEVISNGIESLDYEEIADTLGTNSRDAQARAEFIMASYKGKADASVVGIVGEDTQAFYDWASENQAELHQAAMRGLLFGNSTSALKSLARTYMQNTIPDDDTLKAGGYETKTEQGESFVKVQGVWMTQRSAARAGLI